MRTFFLKPVRWAIFQAFGKTKGAIVYDQLSGPLGDWIEAHEPDVVKAGLDSARLIGGKP